MAVTFNVKEEEDLVDVPWLGWQAELHPKDYCFLKANVNLFETQHVLKASL